MIIAACHKSINENIQKGNMRKSIELKTLDERFEHTYHYGPYPVDISATSVGPLIITSLIIDLSKLKIL